MKLRVVLFVTAFITWILLSFSLDPAHLVSGAFIGILVSFLTADVFEKEPHVFRRPTRYLWFICFIPLFIWECIKANLDGAYRVIHPDLPLKPGIVKVRTTLKSSTGMAFLANSITLRPGTMTVDIDQEGGFLYVHWVDVKTQDVDKATEFIVQRFERILKKIFE